MATQVTNYQCPACTGPLHYVGESGIATGSHLDYAVIKNGQQVDPMQYYDESTVTYDPTA